MKLMTPSTPGGDVRRRTATTRAAAISTVAGAVR